MLTGAVLTTADLGLLRLPPEKGEDEKGQREGHREVPVVGDVQGDQAAGHQGARQADHLARQHRRPDDAHSGALHHCSKKEGRKMVGQLVTT